MMIKKLGLGFVAVCVSASVWAFSPADLSTQLQKPQSVQGSFTQQRHLRSLNKPMQTEGQFALRNKVGLFWHVQKPLDLRLRVRADGIAQWDKNRQVWRNSTQSGQSTQVKLFMAVLGGDTQELQKQFEMQLSGTPAQWQLNLKPKTAVMKQIFQSISIQGDQLVRRVELHEKQGERTVMQFKNLQTDKALSEAAKHALP